MNKISVEEALELAEQHFPSAPEKLAELLEVEVRRRAFKGDGICVKYVNQAIIVINSEVPTTRQRFTLAHELGHLILDIPSVFDEIISESRNGSSEEEKRVNELAEQILLPLSVVRRAVRALPISLKTIKKLAKEARVSEPFVARRLTSLASDLGLERATVIGYQNEKYKWHYNSGPRISLTAKNAETLLGNCQQAESRTWELFRPQKSNVSIATLLPNSHLSLQTIFVQRVRQSDYRPDSTEATIRDLEKQLLEDYESLRSSLQGCVSGMKKKSASFTLDEAVAYFNQQYLAESSTWDDEFCQRLLSSDGQNYLRMRFQPWILNTSPA